MLCKCGKEMSVESRQGVFANIPWRFNVWSCRECHRMIEIDEEGNKRWIETAAKPPTMFDPEVV